jgi:UDP-glucose 4-epimerase
MNILITGGAGFIGSHLVDACLARGDTVSIIDNLSTGREENISTVLSEGKVELHRIDIRNKEALLSVFESFKPDVVCHLAAQINVRTSMKDPLQDAEINIIGGLNVLECMRAVGCKRIIFSSTGGALFDDDRLPYDETMTPSPSSPYGIAKLTLERYLEFYSHQYGFETTILRYANVYGPRQNPLGEAGVVSIFCDLIKK